jgi:hypothetical protein
MVKVAVAEPSSGRTLSTGSTMDTPACGFPVGEDEGLAEGTAEGVYDGFEVGTSVGSCEGVYDGFEVGVIVGNGDGVSVGIADGAGDGAAVGNGDGVSVGTADGAGNGTVVGTGDGEGIGTEDGEGIGTGDGTWDGSGQNTVMHESARKVLTSSAELSPEAPAYMATTASWHATSPQQYSLEPAKSKLYDAKSAPVSHAQFASTHPSIPQSFVQANVSASSAQKASWSPNALVTFEEQSERHGGKSL